MSAKQIAYSRHARTAILHGVNALANAVNIPSSLSKCSTEVAAMRETPTISKISSVITFASGVST